MKKISKIFVLAGVAALGIASCKRVDDSPVNPRYGSLSETRTTLERTPNIMAVDGSNGGSYSFGRCRVVVPANAFQDYSGAAVTGSVELQVRDILRRSEMIFSRVLPVSNGDPLVSGGEIQISANQNGTPLRLRPGKAIQVNIPQNGRDATGMQLFAGDAIDSVGDGANTINWRLRRDAPPAGVVLNGDTVSLFTDSLGWSNADRFLTNPNYQSFTVTVSGTATNFDKGQLLGYASYDEFNGAWPLNSRTGNVFQEQHVPNIPVHFVVYGVKDGRFYGGIAAATPTNGSNYSVVLMETTVLEFKARVDAL